MLLSLWICASVIPTTSAVPFVQSCYFHFIFSRNDPPHDAGQLFMVFDVWRHIALGAYKLECLVWDIFEHSVRGGPVSRPASVSLGFIAWFLIFLSVFWSCWSSSCHDGVSILFNIYFLLAAINYSFVILLPSIFFFFFFAVVLLQWDVLAIEANCSRPTVLCRY